MLSIDGDGSNVSIGVEESELRARILRARDLFERRCGRLLDTGVTLEPGELKDAIAQAEQQLRDALAADGLLKEEEDGDDQD